MSRISTSKLALVLLLATLLTPATGWSAGRRFSSDDSAARIFTIENPLVVFWSYIVGFWDKEGCGIDPDGCAAPNGCGIDPHGGCTPNTSTTGTTTNQDAGCGLDPDGRCLTGN
ncbi:MAG TPA: hypothetical protein VF789_31405 [Thermoanaerobaculia bacterium]